MKKNDLFPDNQVPKTAKMDGKGLVPAILLAQNSPTPY
jgi:hypothetical protein